VNSRNGRAVRGARGSLESRFCRASTAMRISRGRPPGSPGRLWRVVKAVRHDDRVLTAILSGRRGVRDGWRTRAITAARRRWLLLLVDVKKGRDFKRGGGTSLPHRRSRVGQPPRRCEVAVMGCPTPIVRQEIKATWAKPASPREAASPTSSASHCASRLGLSRPRYLAFRDRPDTDRQRERAGKRS